MPGEESVLIDSSRYQGYIDPVSCQVGHPPDWVQPAGPHRTNSNDTTNTRNTGNTTRSSQHPLSIESTNQISGPATGSPGPVPAPIEDPALAAYPSSPLAPPPPPQLKQGLRNASASGGVQVVLDETGAWSELADKSSVPPTPNKKPAGMLGFLARRRGRAASPKPQERGVLGREGARVIIA